MNNNTIPSMTLYALIIILVIAAACQPVTAPPTFAPSRSEQSGKTITPSPGAQASTTAALTQTPTLLITPTLPVTLPIETATGIPQPAVEHSSASAAIS